ncbi:hypothetical protein WNZ15_04600 [Roseibium sp. AS2]|uniref:hypothetical protein n=1 Tax=Roseibium sp. AS2 TaxID=3135781 RepID=UPI0031724CB3
MANLFYWSPAGGTNNFTDGHYLRLGTYESRWEPGSADIKDPAGVAQGIYFYSDGKYTLKTTATGDVCQEIGTGVERTVKSGGYSYTNTTGNHTIAQKNGDVLIEAEGKVVLSSAHEGIADTSILIDAKSNDLYYQQAGYAKFVDTYKETTVKGYTHKTNIGVVLKFYLGGSVGTYSHIGLSIKTATFGIKEVTASATGVSLSMNGNSSTDVLGLKFGFTIFALQVVWLHEEYEFLKNELQVYKRITKLAASDAQIVDAQGAVIGTRTAAAAMDSGLEVQC